MKFVGVLFPALIAHKFSGKSAIFVKSIPVKYLLPVMSNKPWKDFSILGRLQHIYYMRGNNGINLTVANNN